MEDINLKELLHIFLRRWWILLLCVAAFGSGAYVWTKYYTIPLYAAGTTLYVGKNVDQIGIQANDLYLGLSLVQDYREIARSRLVANEVMDELGITNISAGALASRINVSQRDETRVIQISVVDPDPRIAMNLTNTVADVFRNKVIEIMQVENIQIIDKAELPMYPISPNRNRNIILGVAVGLAIGAGIIILIEFLDDTIKTPDDVKKYVELPVIGTIPSFHCKGRRM